MISSILIAALVAVASSASLVDSALHHVALHQSQSQSQSKPSIPLDKIFTQNELQIIKSGRPIQLTPLLFEQKIHNAWMSGNQDMQQVLKQSQPPVDANKIKQLNEATPIVLKAGDLQDQISQAYGLGCLRYWNEVAQQSHVQIPEMKQADDKLVAIVRQIKMKFMQFEQQPKSTLTKVTFWKFAGRPLLKQYIMTSHPEMSEEQVDQQVEEEMSESETDSESQSQVENKSSSSESENDEFSTNQFGFGFPGYGFGGFGYPGFGGFGFRRFGWGFPGFGFGGFGWRRRFWW